MEYDRDKPTKKGNIIPIEIQETVIDNHPIKNDTEIIPLWKKYSVKGGSLKSILTYNHL